MAQFFRVTDDIDLRGRWHLRSPVTGSGSVLDPRIFTYARPVDVAGPLRLPLRRPGKPMDFTLADFGMPVAHRALAEHIESIAPGAVQRIPVTVEGESEPYEILNILPEVYGLDEDASEIMWWTEADERPEKIGQYRMITHTVIDPARAGDALFFRLGGWKIEIICSARFQSSLARGRYSGLVFQQLASPATEQDLTIG